MWVKDTFFSPTGLPFVRGSSKAEFCETFPCDIEVGDDPRTEPHRAIDISAPPYLVFRWLCQIRVAPYSYDMLNNLGRQSPRTLTPGLENLEVGQRFMTLFTLASFVYDEHVTIKLTRWIPRLLLGDLAISYVVRPRGEAGSRLIVKLTLPRAKRLGLVFQYAMGWLDLMMVGKQMNNIRTLSESHWLAAVLSSDHGVGGERFPAK